MIFLVTVLTAGIAYFVWGNWVAHLWSPENISIKDCSTKVSIIVIARNEEKNIESCLTSISSNDYPKENYEVILVDDHSTDDTVHLAKELNLQNLRIILLSELDQPIYSKKSGQRLAVGEAKYDIIIQTDADCIVGKDWIRTMIYHHSNNLMSTGPVAMVGGNTFLSKWQTYEQIGTMIATNAGIKSGYWYNANAANMIFSKDEYIVYSKEKMYDHASGDDIHLINFLSRRQAAISFICDQRALVATQVEKSWPDFFAQRIRWATKTKGYQWNGLKIFMVLMFLFHFSIFLSLPLSLFLGWSYFILFLVTFLLKYFTDCIVIGRGHQFFKPDNKFALSPIFSLAHTIYLVTIGIRALLVTSYIWKGRVTN